MFHVIANGIQFNSRRRTEIMVLTIQEKVEIVGLIRNFSYQRAAEVFNEYHPDRKEPINKQTVARIAKNLQTRGTLHRKKRTILDTNSDDLKNRISEIVTLNPHAATRKIGIQLGVSNGTVWNVLVDPATRKRFCLDLSRYFRSNPAFRKQILWTDEKIFYINGCFNRQNFR